MISARTYYGGSHAQSLPASPNYLTLNHRFARLWRLRASVPALFVRLQDPAIEYLRLRPGAEMLVWNDFVEDFDIQLANGSVLITCPAGEAVQLELVSAASSAWATTTADLSWDARLRLRLT